MLGFYDSALHTVILHYMKVMMLMIDKSYLLKTRILDNIKRKKKLHCHTLTSTTGTILCQPLGLLENILVRLLAAC